MLLLPLLMLSLAPCDLQRDVSARVQRTVDARLENGLLHVQLLDRVRVLPSAGTCDGDVEVAALIARTWLAEPPRPVAAPRPRARPVVAVVLVEPLPLDEAPAPALVLAEEGEPVSAPPPVAAGPRVETSGRLDAEPATVSVGLSLSAAARASLGGGFAPGVSAAVDLGRRWALRTELAVDAERSIAFATGSVRWWRVGLHAGPRVRLTSGAWFLEPSLALGGAVVLVRGSGFDFDSSGAAFAAGACASLRGGRELARGVELFASASGCAWPLSSRLVVAGAGTATLPLGEATFALGLAWSAR